MSQFGWGPFLGLNARCPLPPENPLLPPVKNVGSEKLLPWNSVLKEISWKNKLIFTEIILLFIRQNTIAYGQRHYECL